MIDQSTYKVRRGDSVTGIWTVIHFGPLYLVCIGTEQNCATGNGHNGWDYLRCIGDCKWGKKFVIVQDGHIVGDADVGTRIRLWTQLFCIW